MYFSGTSTAICCVPCPTWRRNSMSLFLAARRPTRLADWSSTSYTAHPAPARADGAARQATRAEPYERVGDPPVGVEVYAFPRRRVRPPLEGAAEAIAVLGHSSNCQRAGVSRHPGRRPWVQAQIYQFCCHVPCADSQRLADAVRSGTPWDGRLGRSGGCPCRPRARSSPQPVARRAGYPGRRQRPRPAGRRDLASTGLNRQVFIVEDDSQAGLGHVDAPPCPDPDHQSPGSGTASSTTPISPRGERGSQL